MTLNESYHASVTEDQKFTAGFTQTPNAVVRNPNLSMQAKYIYTLLRSYAWQDPDAYPGLERLRSDAGAKEETLRKYISELERAGFIQVERRGLNRTNRYSFPEPGYPPTRGIQTTPNGGYQEHPHRGGSRNPPTGGTTNTQKEEDPRYLDAGNEDSLDDDDYGRCRAPAEEEKNGSEMNNGHKHLASTSLPRLLAAVGAKSSDEYPNLSAEEATRWIEELGLENSAHASLARVASRIRDTHGSAGISAAEEAVQRCGLEYRAGTVSSIDAYLARSVRAALSKGSLAEEYASSRTNAQPSLCEPDAGESVDSLASESEAARADSPTKKETVDKRREKSSKDKEFYADLERDEPEIASCLPILWEIEKWPTGPEADKKTAQALRKYIGTFPDVDPLELCTLFSDWHLDNPLEANSNPRARLRTWFQKDREFGGRASRNRPSPGQVPLNGRRKGEKPVYGVGGAERESFADVMRRKQRRASDREKERGETDG